MLPEEYERINILAQLKKQRALTPAEQQERSALHQKYISEMRASLQAHLDAITIVDEDGTRRKLTKTKVEQ